MIWGLRCRKFQQIERIGHINVLLEGLIQGMWKHCFLFHIFRYSDEQHFLVRERK